MRFSGIPVTVDPDQPPGVMEVRSGESRVGVRISGGWMYGEYPDGPFITDEMARGMADVMRQRAAEDPLLAEDIASLAESMPYVIRPRGDSRPVITCECCGTPVMLADEAEVTRKPWAWKPAIWEPGTGRKHTLRRCTWQQDH